MKTKIEGLFNESYAIIEKDLKDTIKWLSTNGITIRENSRLSIYLRFIQAINDVHKTSNDSKLKRLKIIQPSNAVIDLLTIINISKRMKYRKLRTDHVEKWEKALKGNVSLNNEKETKPRDIEFELYVESLAINKGIATRDTKTDVELILDNRQRIFIECKRLSSLNNIEHNIEKAINKLENVCTINALGVIALSIERIINPIRGVITNEDIFFIDKKITSKVQDFIDRYIIYNKKIIENNYVHLILIRCPIPLYLTDSGMDCIQYDKLFVQELRKETTSHKKQIRAFKRMINTTT